MSSDGAVESISPRPILEVRSPRDGKVIAEVPVTPPESLPGIVAEARRAQQEWARVPMKERVARLGRIQDRWLERASDIASLLMKENGKSEVEALMSEVIPTIDLFKYWIKSVPMFLQREPISLNPINFPGKRGYIDYEPRGVAALITPWNYPTSIPPRTLVPALLAGNAVVWKPSELSPLTGQLLYEIFSADLPPGLLSLVQGDGTIGARLVECDIDFVSFTGSVATGKRIAKSCAERFIPVSLEMGGKNAAIVLEDADLERTSAGLVWGAFANAGQNCAAVSRVFVVRPVAAELEKRIRARSAHVKFGPQTNDTYDVGPVISEKQFSRVLAHVDDAKSGGTKLWSGGERVGSEGNWIAPTILDSPGKNVALYREETFGPTVAITVVENESEAIQRANDSDYGLTASVWTRDLKRGERVAHQLQVGTITVNNTSFTPVIPNAPWAGRKASGHGTTNSHRALGEMVQTRFVLLDKSKGSELWWFPHDETLRSLARALVGTLHRSIGRALGAFPAVIKLLMARKKALAKPVT
jgi:acyl-CoA reductase-like NAD-dependent aldehyde dehydrogenase